MRKIILFSLLLTTMVMVSCKKDAEKIIVQANASELTLSLKELDFGSDKQALSFKIKNATGNALKWELIKDGTWLRPEKTKGQVNSEEEIKLQVSREGIQRGDYKDNMIISFDNGVIKYIPVKMTVGNLAPTAPKVKSVTNENKSHDIKIGTSVNPIITWTGSTDPDGDKISYLIFVGTDEDPKFQVAKIDHVLGKSEYTYKLTTALTKYNTTHYVKVVAEDKFKKKKASDAVSFKTAPQGVFWHKVKNSLTHSLLRNGGTTVHNGSIYYLGGTSGGGSTNVMFKSSNGKNWERIGFHQSVLSGRSGYTFTSFKDKMWLIGGRSGSRTHNDIWSTTDGKTWKKEVDNAPFGGSAGSRAVVHNDKLWLFVARRSGRNKSEIWNTSDGTNWKKVGDGPWLRGTAEVIVHQNKFWVIGSPGFIIGGSRKSGIFSSSDGIAWTHVSQGHSLQNGGMRIISFADKIWRVGGGAGTDRSQNPAVDFDRRLYVTQDGKKWDVATRDMGFGMSSNEVVIFKNKVYTITKDVWVMD